MYGFDVTVTWPYKSFMITQVSPILSRQLGKWMQIYMIYYANAMVIVLDTKSNK